MFSSVYSVGNTAPPWLEHADSPGNYSRNAIPTRPQSSPKSPRSGAELEIGERLAWELLAEFAEQFPLVELCQLLHQHAAPHFDFEYPAAEGQHAGLARPFGSDLGPHAFQPRTLAQPTPPASGEQPTEDVSEVFGAFLAHQSLVICHWSLALILCAPTSL